MSTNSLNDLREKLVLLEQMAGCEMDYGSISDAIQNAYILATESIPLLDAIARQHTREPDVEAGARAIRDHETNHCGLTLSGETIFCDDQRLEGEMDGYGKPLRHGVCACREQAKACYLAAGWTVKE